MTIIVTGGAGFIGSNFVFHMLKKYPDYRIVCLDKLTYAGNLSTLEPVMDNQNFRFVKLDICDREGVYKLFEEEHPDMVVNFASESHKTYVKHIRTCLFNTVSVYKCVRYFRKNPVGNVFLYFSYLFVVFFKIFVAYLSGFCYCRRSRNVFRSRSLV